MKEETYRKAQLLINKISVFRDEIERIKGSECVINVGMIHHLKLVGLKRVNDKCKKLILDFLDKQLGKFERELEEL